MARVTVIADTNETRTPYTVVNALITDYLSQTDTSAQALASTVTVVAGKQVNTNTIGETTAANGVTIDGVNLKDSNVELATGKVKRTVTALAVLGVGATTFAVTGEAMVITGDGGGNTVATITGGATGQLLILTFVDALVTITDTDAHTANTMDLSAAFVSADDKMLTLFFDGTSWYEISRSVN
jgi:hypothetical protein